MRTKIGNLLLAIWLILTGLIALTNISIPSRGTLMALLALVAGILLILGH